jgi:Mg/Co/Ni transporter MgtE
MDYDSLRDKLFELLQNRKLKALQIELDEMNEFDVAEFLTELGEREPKSMATVFRLLSKERGRRYLPNWMRQNRKASSIP